MSRPPSIFIRHHLILIKGIEGAAVGRHVWKQEWGLYNICCSLVERKQGSSVLMTDVSVYPGRDTNHHRLRRVEIIHLMCQGQGFLFCYRSKDGVDRCYLLYSNWTKEEGLRCLAHICIHYFQDILCSQNRFSSGTVQLQRCVFSDSFSDLSGCCIQIDLEVIDSTVL